MSTLKLNTSPSNGADPLLINSPRPDGNQQSASMAPALDPSSLITQVERPDTLKPSASKANLRVSTTLAANRSELNSPMHGIGNIPSSYSTNPGVAASSPKMPIRSQNVSSDELKQPTFINRFFLCFGLTCCDPTTPELVPLKNVSASHLNNRQILLPPQEPRFKGRKCLVLDLDETLVHSSFKPVENSDFIIPVEIEQTIHQVYVLKRPHVDDFLKAVGELFEIVVFTASLSKYADPVLDTMDMHKVVKHRLFRESCVYYEGAYVKDLSLLGRDLKDVIIIDNSPTCYLFHPLNAIAISSWFEDSSDTALMDMMPFLKDLARVDDVTLVLNARTR